MSETVKLVIEIPKGIYERTRSGEGNSEFNIPLWLCYSITFGKPLSKVLAEIREEIDNLDMEYDCNTYYGGISDALEIIDKHISGEGGK